MATYTTISEGKVRAQVRKTGMKATAQTFTGKTTEEAKELAIAWAIGLEQDHAKGKAVGVQGETGATFGECVDKFMKEKPDLHPSQKSALRYMKDFMGDTKLVKMTPQLIIEYIEDRDFGPASGLFHFTTLKAVFKRAHVAWDYHVPDIMDKARDKLKYLGLIGKSHERDRRITDEELAKLLAYDYPTKMPMAKIIMFTIHTAMRRAEVTRITRHTYDKEAHTVLIPERKHPTKKKTNHQVVPLTPEAVEIMDYMLASHNQDKVFPWEAKYISVLFTNACTDLGIENLHFHDLRHEGTSRLFERGLEIQQVAAFTGHSDWSMLKRYTHLKPADIAKIAKDKQTKEEQKVVPEPQHEMSMFSKEEMEEMKQQVRQELKREMMAKMMKQFETA